MKKQTKLGYFGFHMTTNAIQPHVTDKNQMEN